MIKNVNKYATDILSQYHNINQDPDDTKVSHSDVKYWDQTGIETNCLPGSYDRLTMDV